MPTDSEILTGMADHFGPRGDITVDEADTLRKYAAIARAVESEEWKLVPKAATMEMISAARESGAEFGFGYHYVKAIAAAPQFQEEGK